MFYRSDAAAVTHQAVVRSDARAITDDGPGREGIAVRLLEMKARIYLGRLCVICRVGVQPDYE